MDLAELQGLGADPIRPDAPGGDPYRDEPDFEMLQAEMGRLERADGEQPDWGKVVRLASMILREKSKDLLAAAYLVLALFRREDYPGLASGLTILADMIDRHWDALYPVRKRLRGRLGAIDWLTERGAAEVKRRRPRADQAAAVGACNEQVERLGELLGQKAEGEGGRFSELATALREALRAAEQPPAAAPPPPPSAAAPSAGGGLSTSPVVSDAGDATKLLGQIRTAAARLGAYYRSSDAKNPMGYALPRALAWAHLYTMPPNTDGKTTIPAPQPPDQGDKLQECFDQGQWAGVLERTEDIFQNSVLWLDLHRYAAQALENQGEDYVPAAGAVCRELAGLLQRLPGLDQLQFANGEPLAAAATRSWIRDRVLPGAKTSDVGEAGTPPSIAAPSPSSEPAVAADLKAFGEGREQARRLARRRKLSEALRLLEDGARGCRTLRGRATWMLEMGRLTLDRGNARAAYAQFQTLQSVLEQGGIDEWDPEFSREFLKGLFLSHKEVLSSQKVLPAEELARSLEIHQRLCRLDAAVAAELAGKR